MSDVNEKIAMQIECDKYCKENAPTVIRSLDFNVDFILSRLGEPKLTEESEHYIEQIFEEGRLDNVIMNLRQAFFAGFKYAQKKKGSEI